MFAPGEYVHYQTSGLCRVEEITKLSAPGTEEERLYYRLTPMDTQGGSIFTPVENPKTGIRRVMNAEEARELIDLIPDIGELEITEEKQRERCYREAVQSLDCRCWVQALKTLYKRNQTRLAQGKKITSTDERYMKTAETRLFSELSLALGKSREDVESDVSARISCKVPLS